VLFRSAMLLAALARLLGIDLGVLGDVVAPALGVAGVAATGILLVSDLRRPARFLYIFLMPNVRSWMFWGAVALAAGAAFFTVWLVIGLLGTVGVLSVAATDNVLFGLGIPTFLAAAMTTGDTCFLCGPAEGRELWQPPWRFGHLIVAAFMVGGGALVIAAIPVTLSEPARTLLVAGLTLGTALHLAMVLAEHLGRHPTANAAAAARMLTRGRYARMFWSGGIGLGAIGLVLSAIGWAGPLVAALTGGIVVQFALAAYESVFIRAGQDVPLS